MLRAGLVCLVLALVLGQGWPVHAQRTLNLPAGKKLALDGIKVMNVNPVLGDSKVVLCADVRVAGGGQRMRKQLSVFADEFFLLYFGVYAETEGYRTASIWFKKNVTAGPLTFTSAESSTYNLRENGVWEPEHDALKDDRPLPEPTRLELSSGRAIFVEWAGVAYLNKPGKEGWGSDYWSKISFETDPGAIYRQSREYWHFVRDKIDPSIGLAGISGYDRRRLGLFHFRKYMYLIIRMNEKGEWQELPPTLEEAMGRKSRLIEASFGPKGMETVWPERQGGR